jgi:DNA modification methylase
VKVAISKIKPNPKNPRVIRDDSFKKLVESVRDFPEMLEKRALVCYTDTDGKLVVLGGNQRLKALKEIGAKEAPVILADDWTAEQKEKFILYDNADVADWNWAELSEWQKEELADWGEVEPGFKATVLEAEEDDFEVPEGGIETDIVLGDLFEIGEHRLLCGDSTDSDAVAKLMNGEKADMVFTDPPYGVNYSGRGKNTTNTIENDNLSLQETEEMVFGALTNAFIFSREGATIFVWHADSKPGLRPLFEKAFLESGWGLRATIIWQKKQASMGYADYRSQHEPCLYGWKGVKKERLEDRTQTTLWEGGRDQNYVHPTQKPLFLCETAIKNHNPKLLIDFFLGSGSTMVASHQLKRKCYGMELDPKYCQVIVDRMKKLDPSLVIKKNGVELK